MKHLTILCLLALCLFSSPCARAQTTTSANQKLDAMITKGMADWKIPGLAAVVVKDGQVVFQKAYGVKNLETKAPVDENTLFNMGSTTKAVICIALGMLADQGKLQWEDKVRKYLPAFQLSDPYITEEARVQDLLTHNLGIDQADLLWVVDSTSTEETLARFRFAEKAYPIRGGFIYNNLMYAVAGEVIRAASGQHWTTFVKENIFKPLEMTHTVAKAADLFKGGNYVTPYVDDIEDGLVTANYNLSDQIGAAGMIWSCGADIGHYLTFLVNGGVYKSDTLLKPATFRYLFEPHAFVNKESFYPTQSLTHPNWITYGLGWFQTDYRGVKLDFHTGSISGLIAIAGVMHDKKTAVYVFSNLDHAELRHAILYKAMDLYAFGDDSRDWHREIFDLYMGFRRQAAAGLKKQAAARVPNTKPSLDLKAYAGVYAHEMLGTVEVSVENDRLIIHFNHFLTLQAHHWHYDTFQSDKNNRYKDAIMVNFNLDQQGAVEEMEAFGERFRKTAR